jgi:putative tryptophan/tyrosine transport system substrate-binding protein
MRRRALISAVGFAAAWSIVRPVAAQSGRKRVGFLLGTPETAEGRAWVDAMRQGLRVAGWEDGRNLDLETHWGGANRDHIGAGVQDIVEDSPAVIIARSSRALKALHTATKDIPIVFIAASDPVKEGFAESLSKPGGNVTGFLLFEPSVAGKLAEILNEIAPKVTRAGLLYDPQNVSAAGYWRAIQEVAPLLGISPARLPVRDSASIEAAVKDFAREPNAGLLLPSDATTTTFRESIVALAARYGLPAAYTYRADVQSGGLVSYGPDLTALFRRAGAYAGRILNGEKPGDLPVQTAERFEMALNLRTAAGLGLTVSPSLLARADEVIE